MPQSKQLGFGGLDSSFASLSDAAIIRNALRIVARQAEHAAQ
jgi:hypothetical protein